jgi:hypothetical protein
VKGSVAVITDAVSPDFMFPIWHKYYGTLFGYQNLFVVTYRGKKGAFSPYEMGGLLELPTEYEDEVRRAAITSHVSTLLTCYEIVIRVDVDEILVVAPHLHINLREYITNSKMPYFTARGFDVIQLPTESPITSAANGNVLRNRDWAYPNTALNKTCVTRVPISWSSGFHWATVYPQFCDLFMLHLKRIDIGWQMHWCNHMRDNAPKTGNARNFLMGYYKSDEKEIVHYHEGVVGRIRLNCESDWYRNETISNFLNNVNLVPETLLYAGKYGHEDVLCRIPDTWKELV